MGIRELKVSHSKAARKLASVRIRWPASSSVAWRMDKSGLPVQTNDLGDRVQR